MSDLESAIIKWKLKNYFKNAKTLKSTFDDLMYGIIEAHKQCPNSENKSFEEVATWCGQHVLIQETKS